MNAPAARLFALSGLLTAACAHSPSAKEGKSLYADNGCASCHGSSGRGDGPAAATVPVPPTDLTDLRIYQHGNTELAIAQTLVDGIAGSDAGVEALRHSHHTFVMPKFDHLTEFERRSIALYLISLAKH